MPHYVAEVPKIWTSDLPSLEAYLRRLGLSGTVNLRTATVGSALHVVFELPHDSLDPGIRIVAGPMGESGARAHLAANGW